MTDTLEAATAALARRRGLGVLCYHTLADALDDYPYRTRAAAFARHLDLLTAAFEVVAPGRALALWDADDFAGRDRPVAALTFDDGYREVADLATPELDRRGLAAGLFVARNQVERRGATHLDPAGVRALADHPGWEVGAHALAHDSLYSLRQLDLEAEVADSKAWLADISGRAPATFAYPQGKLSRRVVETVRPHYEAAFATDKRIPDTPDRHQIRRLCPTQRHDDPAAFARLLAEGTWEVAAGV
jgi:peptidoglycan/xylan/chitin deacetylase (PgdA/CDA1 family)